jgi:sirohydrochlorin ferrochelatase
MQTVLLLDNGSSRAKSTLSLRRLAAALGERIGVEVHPVSLLHANRVPAEALGGRAADTFAPFLRRHVAAGADRFVVLPLFFGRSGALTGFIPETVETLQAELGPFVLDVADVLCPLPEGEPRLARILCDNLALAASGLAAEPRVVLVDHGSPLPEVTEVRRWLAGEMRAMLGTAVEEAVMERRPGPAYDFNGPLLETVLHRLAEADPSGPVGLAMLFLSAGRHAGAGGDVEQICRQVQAEHPGLAVAISPLVGSHPAILDILEDRYRARVPNAT